MYLLPMKIDAYLRRIFVELTTYMLVTDYNELDVQCPILLHLHRLLQIGSRADKMFCPLRASLFTGIKRLKCKFNYS
jgi:hypothetical protein